MSFLRSLHTFYGFTVFSLLFLLFFPLFLIPIFFPRQFHLVGVFNRWWAKALFIFCFLPYHVECKSKLDSKKQYIFCPNHFSFLDIPTMGLNPINTIFVGKSEMENIPVFGYMYRKLHITVDRSKLKSKFNTMLRSLEALEAGKSLVIYPEGGIVTKRPPQLSMFKDGAFRIAIEKQVAIVPVTIPHNWQIMPDARRQRLHRGKIKLVVHAPIETKGITIQNLDKLKQQVFDVIDRELQQRNYNLPRQ